MKLYFSEAQRAANSTVSNGMGHNSTKGHNPKKYRSVIFYEESIYEISKPYLKICSDGRTSPKQYAP